MVGCGRAGGITRLCPFCLLDRIAEYGSVGGRKQFRCTSCGNYFTRVPMWSYSKHSLYNPEVLRLYSLSRTTRVGGLRTGASRG